MADLKKFTDAASKVGAAVATGQSGEMDGIRAKRDNVAEYEAATTDKPAAPKTATPTADVDKVNPKGKYGTGRGEQRIDVSNWTKKLPVYHKGVDSVPKTGPAVLKKGEKVVPAEHNPDNPDNAVDEAVSGHSNSEKAHFSRAMTHLHKGALHEHFGIPKDQPIPMEKKEEAAKSSNKHVAAMGRMAVAMHGWKK